MDVSALSSVGALPQVQGAIETQQNKLGMDDFFKLLTTQLVNQDPLQPMQDTEFISQMASFSSLSQMELIAQNTDASRQQQEATAVMSLIGKHVTATGSEGESLAGVITKVESVDGKLVPYIGDQAVPFKNISKITNERGPIEAASTEA